MSVTGEAAVSPGAPAPSPDRPAARRGRLSRGDRRAVAVLVGVPLVVFVLPALAGHPALAGDNLLQSFPLRALSGDQLRQGHLPLWNPLIWSGNPLLGGLNAGALYPGTFAFAVLGPVAAWVLNLVVTYWVAGLGCYGLLRNYRVRPLGAGLGAATFAFTGAMVAQMPHLPIVQGWAWVPLLVLAELRMAAALLGVAPGIDGPRAVPRRSPWPSTLALAATGGLILLTGEPRGMAEAELVALVVTVWVVGRPYAGLGVDVARRARFVGQLAVAAVWAVALGAAQLVPGWSFIATTERASATLTFFGSGSLAPKWSALLFVPEIFGGDGIAHMPIFFATYNLPEVTGYVGLLPLAAALALLTRSLGRRRDRRASDWGVWLVLLVVGLLATFGTYTVFGGAFFHLPLFNKTRLQSRNLGIVDLSLAVLLGFWVDRLVHGSPAAASVTGWRRWVTAAPAVLAAALCLFGLAIPRLEQVALDTPQYLAGMGGLLRPWFGLQLAVAVAVLALILAWPRLAAVTARRLLVGVVTADIVIFTAVASTGLNAGRGPTYVPSSALARAVLGTDGRFGFYDTTALSVNELDAIGQPDLNAFTGLPSVGGYGSTVSGAYGTVTGAHTLETLDPCALARGVFDPLRLATVLTLPEFLAPAILTNGTVVTPPPPNPPTSPPGQVCRAPAPGAGGTRTLYLGQVLDLTGARLVGAAGTPPVVGVLTATGGVRVPGETVRPVPGGWSVAFAAPVRAAGLVVTGARAPVSDTSSATAVGGDRFVFSGPMQDALGVRGWRYRGQWKNYARFARPVRPPVWVQGGPGAARVDQQSTTDWGSQTDRLDAPRAVTVVRSEAYAPGWRVEAVPVGGGSARSLPVVPDGLVQAVRVPAGRWTLTFTYGPTAATVGVALSAAAVVAMAVAGAVIGWRRRRVRAAGPPNGVPDRR